MKLDNEMWFFFILLTQVPSVCMIELALAWWGNDDDIYGLCGHIENIG